MAAPMMFSVSRFKPSEPLQRSLAGSATSAFSPLAFSSISNLCVSSAPLRLCGGKPPSLLPRSRLPLQDFLQDVVLLQTIGFGMEVQQDPVPQHRDVQR